MKKPVVLFFCVACSTTQQKKFDDSLTAGKCEDAIKNIPSSSSSQLLKQTKQISGTIASYVITGLTYGTEVTVYITGGIAGGNGSASGGCVRVVSETIARNSFHKGSFGEKVYNSTNNWRCPDLTDFSVGLRSVASCYENKDNFENLQKAKEQLEIIRNKEFQASCVNDEERKEILNQYERIQKKLEEFKKFGARS